MSNPVVYSGFISKRLTVYEDNVDNPAFASRVLDSQGSDLSRFNVLYTLDFTRYLASGASIALSIPQLALTDWVIIVGEIIGDGKFTVAGLDADGVTAITCPLRGVGNETFPAKVYYSGSNVQTVTLGSSQDNTLFRGHVLIACSDTDPRYS